MMDVGRLYYILAVNSDNKGILHISPYKYFVLFAINILYLL